LNTVDSLHGKVNEIAEYGMVTVEGFGRLDSRYVMARPDALELKNLHIVRSLSSIASQLSRIESLLYIKPCSTSSPVAPKFMKTERTGSNSSNHSAYSAPPVMISESWRYSSSLWPITASKNISA